MGLLKLIHCHIFNQHKTMAIENLFCLFLFSPKKNNEFISVTRKTLILANLLQLRERGCTNHNMLRQAIALPICVCSIWWASNGFYSLIVEFALLVTSRWIILFELIRTTHAVKMGICPFQQNFPAKYLCFKLDFLKIEFQ